MISLEGLTFRMREVVKMLDGLSQAFVAGLADLLIVGHWRREGANGIYYDEG